MRTVFLGTSEFAAGLLTDLCSADDGAFRPALVLTRPDRPAGRGRKLSSPPVAPAARELGLELAQPESVNDEQARASIAAARPQAVIVCAFGALIKQPLLDEYELLNVHPSLLPRWRGAAPIERALMAGEEQTGVSIMRVTEGLDSGPLYMAQTEPIAPQDTYGSLAPRLQRLGARLLLEALRQLQRGEQLPCAEQDDAMATYAEKIAPADRLLDPSRPAAELERVVRALTPHIGARLALADGGWLGVRQAALLDVQAAGPEGLYAQGERLLFGCSPGTLELQAVQPPGKRPMGAAAFLRGHELAQA
ncbi:MAG TPA: methionyl-tRNA formyltransferase [Solirubrobacteraceae bacterium]|nr:methionyl-tRNA formyltransferase [Solirubrobacteraceae bacterium]